MKYPKDGAWFNGLKISKHREFDVHRNAYPVIMFDFKDLSVDSVEAFDDQFALAMSDLYSKYRYVLESERVGEEGKAYFKGVLEKKVKITELRMALAKLAVMLHSHHDREVIILLDEYDNPIHNSFGLPHQDYVLSVMRDILSSALKNGEDYLKFGVVTGVMQIAKESIFSGLNNLKVNNIFSHDFGEMFGFTSDEVMSICEEYGHPERFGEAKEWYDGYRFGDTDVYNPWSIVEYVSNGFRPAMYWAGTSGNDILDRLLACADDKVPDMLRSLSQGDSVDVSMDPAITVSNLYRGYSSLFSVLVMTGYLNAVPVDDDGYSLFIPNGEMFQVFGKSMARHIESESGDEGVYKSVRRLGRAFLSADVGAVRDRLYDIFATDMGSQMLDHEHVYQMGITTLLLSLSGTHTVRAESEAGKGRFDIRLESRVPSRSHVLIELKRSESDAAVVKDAEEALVQIRDKDYCHGLKGVIILYGISFRGKVPHVLTETVQR